MKLLRSTAASTVGDVTATPAASEPDAATMLTEVETPPARPRATRTRRALFARVLTPTSPALVYLGIFLLAAGFGLLAFTWSRVAGKAIVSLQLPYVVSGASTGLGLLILGVLCVYLGAKRRDAWQRDRRLEQLAAAFEAIAAAQTSVEPAEDAD